MHEEERISYQRKLLLLYQREIKEHEYKLVNEARNIAMQKTISSKESELDNLLNNLERNVSLQFFLLLYNIFPIYFFTHFFLN